MKMDFESGSNGKRIVYTSPLKWPPAIVVWYCTWAAARLRLLLRHPYCICCCCCCRMTASVRENGILGPFIYKMHHFAKTGSGQTWGKLKNDAVFSGGADVIEHNLLANCVRESGDHGKTSKPPPTPRTFFVSCRPNSSQQIASIDARACCPH
jgi:hypothetical protein